MQVILNNMLNYFLGGFDYLVKTLLFVLITHMITQMIVEKKISISVITNKIGYIIALMVINVVGAFTQQAGWAVIASIRLLGGSYVIIVQACEIFDNLKSMGVEIEFITNFFEKLKSIISSQTIINDNTKLVSNSRLAKLDTTVDDKRLLGRLINNVYNTFDR